MNRTLLLVPCAALVLTGALVLAGALVLVAAPAARGADAPGVAPAAVPGDALEAARSAPPLVLTLEETLALAAKQSQAVLKAREYGASVEANYQEQYASALPQLTLGGSASLADDESVAGLGPPQRTDTYRLKLGVTQPLYTGGQLRAGIRAADIARGTAVDRLAGAQGTALRDAATAFYDVLLARELTALATQNLEQKRRHLEEARRRLAAGTATDYDVLAAEVDERNAQPALIRATNAVANAREHLAHVLGTQGRAVDATGSLEAPAEAAPDAAEALRIAVRNRPELAELRKNRAIAGELVTVAQAGARPRLGFAADGGWNEVAYDERTGDGPSWSVGLVLSWPLFDGGRTNGAVAGAESDARSLELDERDFLEGLAVSTRTGVDAVAEAAAIVDALGGTVAQAERLLAMAERGFELGVKTRLDVDDAQLSVIQARAGLARGRRDLLVARVNLRWLTGTLRPAP